MSQTSQTSSTQDGAHPTQNTITALSAGELATHIAHGVISAADAVEAYIERIEAVNARLNAVVVARYEAARAEARAADERRARGEPLGKLHGVPVTIKECLDLAGTASTFGLPARAGLLAEQDDVYVARLRAEGAIILGKTNVSQLLLYYESDNPVYGRTNNPWNLERSPGGSSGGQAAIIAADGSPLGLGTDLGGSVRIPAAFCGIASLKPTAGRTPDAGRYSIPIGQRAVVSQVGVLARRVGDVALGLEVINGGRDPVSEPPRSLGDLARVDVSQLRVACYVDDGTFPVAPAVRRAVQEAATMLRQAGAQVVEWTPPDASYAADLYFGILSADGGQGIKSFLGRYKRDPRAGMLVFLGGRSRRQLAVFGGLLRLLGQQRLAAGLRGFGHRDTAHYWDLVTAQMDYQRRFEQALDSASGGPCDILLCPACPLPAFTHGASQNLTTAGAYALLYNLLGYPAGVVPVTRVRPDEEIVRGSSRDVVDQTARKVQQGSAGLPVGVQIVARPWREHVALAAMQAIEQAAATQAAFPGTAHLLQR